MIGKTARDKKEGTKIIVKQKKKKCKKGW